MRSFHDVGSVMDGSWVNPKLEVRPSPMGGIGVFVREPIAAGELLTVSVGRVIDDVQHDREVAEVGEDRCFNIGPNTWLAPLDPTNPTADWLVNHSCEPNAVQTADDNLVAWRDIAAGQEVTYDYATTQEEKDLNLECACGRGSCRKIITGNDWRIPELQERYKEFFTTSIQRKIAKIEAGEPLENDGPWFNPKLAVREGSIHGRGVFAKAPVDVHYHRVVDTFG